MYTLYCKLHMQTHTCMQVIIIIGMYTIIAILVEYNNYTYMPVAGKKIHLHWCTQKRVLIIRCENGTCATREENAISAKCITS